MNHSDQIAFALVEYLELLEERGKKDNELAFTIPTNAGDLIVTVDDLREFVCDLGVLSRDSYQI